MLPGDPPSPMAVESSGPGQDRAFFPWQITALPGKMIRKAGRDTLRCAGLRRIGNDFS